MRLGSEIRRRRKAHKWTLERLAQESGLSPHYLSTVETGRRDPSVSTVVAIAKALGVEPGELLGAIKGLSPSSIEAARLFETLHEDGRDAVLRLMRLLRRRK